MEILAIFAILSTIANVAFIAAKDGQPRENWSSVDTLVAILNGLMVILLVSRVLGLF